MIVICTRCQAKFRVADEKIGPRGAKVRCSRCQTVFLVHRDLGTMPAQEAPPPAAGRGDAPAPRAATADNPFASSPIRAPEPSAPMAVPPPLPPPAGAEPGAGDPFGGAGFEAPSPDPFGPPPAGDPFGLPAPAPDDPFASQAGAFAHAGPPPEEQGPSMLGEDPLERPLPVTDLSDLGAGVRAAPLQGPLEPAPPEAPWPPLGTSELLEEDGGLSLEERTTPPPRPVAPPSHAPVGDPFDGPGPGDPFAASAALDPGGWELGGEGAYELGAPEDGPALASEPLRQPAEPEPGPAPPDPAPLELAQPAWAPPARAVPAPRAEGRPRAGAIAGAAPPNRIPGPEGSRLRAVAVNAVGLAALLLASLALLAVFRNDGRLDAVSFRPAALLGLVRSEGASGPFATREVTSGLYERDRAPPVLFVRGAVVSQTPEVVPGVTVAVEVLREGRVVARGEAVAGALPTPEEIHEARSAEDLAAVARGARARAPAEVRPGDEVPFLVVMGDHPADLHGTSLRVDVRASGDAQVGAANGGSRP